MSKLSKEEFLKKYSERIEDSDLQLELMEDIADSFEVDSDSVSSEEFQELTQKYNDLKEKYKSRFLDVKEDNSKKDEKEDEKEDEELEEKEYVDVKDI